MVGLSIWAGVFAGRRPLALAQVAAQTLVALLGLAVLRGAAQLLWGGPPPVSLANWAALIVASVILLAGLWDRQARFSLAGLYACALIALGMAQLQRGFAPARFFLWGAVCDLAGFLLVAALLGWGLARLPRQPGQRTGRWMRRLHLLSATDRWSVSWFPWVQALLAAAVACLTIWIAADLRFDGMGQGVALFGLSGRSAACPAALMLLGTCILMAWQSENRWRASWQYAALAAGVLFTTSVGWAMMESSTAGPWLHRGVKLLISLSMMTLMTGYGLGRFLPRHSDWIERGRRAKSVFAGLALGLLVVLVLLALR
jgi:hypothetical protein